MKTDPWQFGWHTDQWWRRDNMNLAGSPPVSRTLTQEYDFHAKCSGALATQSTQLDVRPSRHARWEAAQQCRHDYKHTKGNVGEFAVLVRHPHRCQDGPIVSDFDNQPIRVTQGVEIDSILTKLAPVLATDGGHFFFFFFFQPVFLG